MKGLIHWPEVTLAIITWFWFGTCGCWGQVKRSAPIPWSDTEDYVFSIAFWEFVLKSVIGDVMADIRKWKNSTNEKGLIDDTGFSVSMPS